MQQESNQVIVDGLFILIQSTKRHNKTSLMTHFIVELHFNDALAVAGHRSPQINVCGSVLKPTAAHLRADESALLFPVVHLFVQLFVAGPGLLDHAHSQTILVHVVVVGHGEHDGHAIGELL